MQIAKIIKGWHLLFVGGNGHKTYGLGCETLNWDPKSGYSHFWHLNDFSFLNLKRTSYSYNLEHFGLTEEEYSKLKVELAQVLENDNKQ
jgi:hypothetical protein